ncbi:MAG: mechanosensitive ion channel [Deltaproteobacteria bacterium]|nr:mechanosensitive ion channel [Deltaproteobacteria bacterium]
MHNFKNTQDDWELILAKLHLLDKLKEFWDSVGNWVTQDLLEVDTLYELGVLAAIFAVSWLLARWLRGILSHKWAKTLERGDRPAQWRRDFLRLLGPVISLAFLWPLYIFSTEAGMDNDLVSLCANTVGAWVVIRLVAAVLFRPFWARFFAVFIWVIAALSIFGLLGSVVQLLDAVKLTVGSLKLSLLEVLESLLFFIVLLRLGIRAGSYLEDRLAASGELEPSTRTLIGLLSKTVIIVIVAILSLEIIGVDMDMLTVFSGALGFGLGIGLRTVFSNLISGIIIMMDKSIRPGDVIWIGDVFGKVSALRARYASVVTRDGQEYLIPNEDLLSRQVINCSYSSREVRLKVPIDIAFGSDVELAMSLAEQAAQGIPRILQHPAPACRLVALGHFSINLSLRFWIADPEHGVSNVTTEVLKKVLKLFAENGVEIPYPQQDVHIKDRELTKTT